MPDSPMEPTATDPHEQPDLGPDYVNPAEHRPRCLLYAHTYALRLGASLGFGLGNCQHPATPTVSKSIWLDSSLSNKWSGKDKIKVDVWEPSQAPSHSISDKRPAIINFHGGGFILGQGTDDARWAAAAGEELNAVIFSVNYRLAPGYPFPTTTEDCTDAVLQICAAADEHRIDMDRVILSGFSAGATSALGCWNLLQDPRQWGYHIPSPIPKFAGLVLFYPVLDWTLDRPQKRRLSKRPDLTLPPSLTDTIDASYIFPPLPRLERIDIRLSPGLLPDDLLALVPPIHLCLCEYDMLLVEGQKFAERLRAAGRTISVRVVEGEKHAWDKPLPLAPKESVAVEYGKAIEAIKSWLGPLA